MSQKYQLTKYHNGYFFGSLTQEKAYVLFDSETLVLKYVDIDKKGAAANIVSLLESLLPLNLSGDFQKEILRSIEVFFPFYANIHRENMLDGYNSKRDLTFFGGSFDPLHEGHVECLRQCSRFEENLVVVPDYSPWKNNQVEGPLAQIVKLEKQLSAVLETVRFFPVFWGYDQRNPTSVWIKNIVWPSGINWLMGEDTFNSLLKWYEVDVFLSALKKIYICPRLNEVGQSFDNKLVLDYLGKNHSTLELIWLTHHSYEELSSSKLRALK